MDEVEKLISGRMCSKARSYETSEISGNVKRSGTAELGAVYAKLSFLSSSLWAAEIPGILRVYSLNVNSGL